MPVERTELRNELKAMIAAGRDLTPDHDEALAEVFLDHIEQRTRAPMRVPGRPMVVRRARGVIAAVCLAAACVGGGAVVVSHGAVGSSSGPQSVQMKAQPIVQGKLPGGLKLPKASKMQKVVPAPKSP